MAAGISLGPRCPLPGSAPGTLSGALEPGCAAPLEQERQRRRCELCQRTISWAGALRVWGHLGDVRVPFGLAQAAAPAGVDLLEGGRGLPVGHVLLPAGDGAGTAALCPSAFVDLGPRARGPSGAPVQ